VAWAGQVIYALGSEGVAMKLHTILGAALALAACSPGTEPATVGGAAEKRMPLPDCSEVQTQDQGADGWKHPDCRMMLADNSGLAIEARYTKAEDESTKVAVQIVAPGDATLQTIDETMGNTFNGLTQQDIDEDGKSDLLLPLETGNVNTTWAVWRQEDGPSFRRAGELSGISIERTADGFIATPARSSANAWGVEFWRLDGGILFPVATAEVTAEITGDGKPGKVECAVLYDGDIAGIGLPPAEAEKKFCAEPIVTGVFN
jgi:hypothetical protein